MYACKQVLLLVSFIQYVWRKKKHISHQSILLLFFRVMLQRQISVLLLFLNFCTHEGTLSERVYFCTNMKCTSFGNESTLLQDIWERSAQSHITNISLQSQLPQDCDMEENIELLITPRLT